MLLELIFVVSLPISYTITYILAKRSIKRGLFEAYEDIMDDILSDETQTELQMLGKSIVGGAMKNIKGGVKQMFPKIKIQDAIAYFILSKTGLLNIEGLTQQQEQPTQEQQPQALDRTRR